MAEKPASQSNGNTRSVKPQQGGLAEYLLQSIAERSVLLGCRPLIYSAPQEMCRREWHGFACSGRYRRWCYPLSMSILQKVDSRSLAACGKFKCGCGIGTSDHRTRLLISRLSFLRESLAPGLTSQDNTNLLAFKVMYKIIAVR